ncbi:MAG: hypothetical protein AAGE13_04590 [Pseudomonadota bacterium]
MSASTASGTENRDLAAQTGGIHAREALRLFLLGLALAGVGNLAATLYFDPVPGLERAIPFMDHWKLFQFQTSYADLGFVRRGLVGSALGLAPDAAPVWLPGLAALPALALIAAMAAMLSRLTQPGLAIALLVSPGLCLNIGFDLGRFDHINILLMLAAIARPGWSLSILAPLMLLIHEAALLAQLPLLFALHLRRTGADTAFWAAGAAVLATLAALMLLGARHSPEALLAQYPLASPDSLRVVTRGLAANIAEVADYAVNRMARDLQIAFVLPAGYLALLVSVYLRMAGPAWPNWALAAMALAPLGLSIVGLDFARWFALAAINLIILTCLAARGAQRATPGWQVAALGLFALPGPLGLVYPYPLGLFSVLEALGLRTI